MKLETILYRLKKDKFAYSFIAPAVIGIFLLNFIPFVMGLKMSFFRLHAETIRLFFQAPFVGFQNYFDVLINPLSPIRIGLFQAVRNTVYYAIIVTVGQLFMGMIVALLLNRDFRGRALVRTLFLFPWIVPTFVTGLLWGFMWQKNIGVINYAFYDVHFVHNILFNWIHIHYIVHYINILIAYLLYILLFPFFIYKEINFTDWRMVFEQVGQMFPLLPELAKFNTNLFFNSVVERPFWLNGPNTFWAIVVPTIWRYWPLSMLMILAGLQNIPDSLYEAASIDGASAWKKFWTITFPLLKPVWAILLMFGIIANVYSFNIVIMMFGNGAGYPGEWGDLMMTNIFRNSFEVWNFGTGSAASILFMAFMSIVIYFWYRFYISSEEVVRNK